MFSLDYIISYLYPNKNQQQVSEMADALLDSAEYNIYTWKLIKKQDLDQKEVQKNLVKTLFESQFVYPGSVSEILRDLEEWGGANILFKDFNEESVLFYQYFYCLLGFLNFGNINYTSKLNLLNNKFLLMACALDVPVYHSVQRHFVNIVHIDMLREDSDIFSKAIANNQTLLGDEGKLVKPISKWIKMFVPFSGTGFVNKVDEFINDSMEVNRLFPDLRKVLHKIITVYWFLKTNIIWKEIEDYNESAGHVYVQKKDQRTIKDHYIDLLKEIKEPREIEMWLEDYKEVALWLDVTEKSEEFVVELLKVLKTKVDLSNSKQVDLLYKFIFDLKERELTEIENVIYFDEQAGQFKWDEELLS
ncbi:MAG: hypothetical protein ABIH87_01065 [bacterium]